MKPTLRIRDRLFPAVTAALLALSISAAHAATLKPQVVVHDDKVLLRDIFDGAGKYGDTALFRAPPPGQSVLLTGRWLRQVARSYELAWQPGPGLDESRVTRSSNRIGAETIKNALGNALEKRIDSTKQYEITLDNPNQEIHLPVRMPTTITVRNLFFDPRSNRYTATVVAPDDRPGAVAVQVAGRVHELVAVPVLSRRFRPGEIIRERDLDTQLLRTEQIARNAIAAPDQIIGKSARRSLYSGKPLSSGDIREPQLVSRGSMVIMQYKAANMVITAHGTARENGTAGETVRVRNTNSGKIIEAVVVGQDTVAVMPLSSPRNR